MIDEKEAVSPIISMILLITIVLVVTAAILSWATPILQRSQSEANYGAVLGYFNALDSGFEDVVNMGEGASRTVDVSVGAGSIYMSESMNETWVVSYGFEGQPRVNISGLDDESKTTADKNFTVDSTPSQNVNVTVYKVEDNNFRNICVGGYDNEPTPNQVSAIEGITGTVYIRVNNSGNTETLAELWLFDITPITYELSSAFG
ncbi:MAG: hypothetical protein QMC80_05285, partial [Thermoplasmatales archaeon]|nr:hypothetical protein [Thermoplasmatales archaeon]